MTINDTCAPTTTMAVSPTKPAAGFTVSSTKTPLGDRSTSTSSSLPLRTDIDMKGQFHRRAMQRRSQAQQRHLREWNETKASQRHHFIMLTLLVHEAAHYQRIVKSVAPPTQGGPTFVGKLDTKETVNEMYKRVAYGMCGPKDRYVEMLMDLSKRLLFQQMPQS